MNFTCREFVEVLFEFVEGELPDDKRQLAQTHLDACPPCVAYVQSYHVTVKICRKLEQRQPPEALRVRFLKAASQLPPEGASHGASR
jgi:hypothetical protein